MNSANFHEYLRNPSMLHQVHYQELKSLAMQYPYSANLRYLMLIKSMLDGNREFERNLVLASLSSPDRKRLRQLVQQYSYRPEAGGNYELSGEFLELKDLTSLEDVLDASPAPAPKTAAAQPPSPQPGPSYLDDLGPAQANLPPDIPFMDDLPADLEELATIAPTNGENESDNLPDTPTMDGHPPSDLEDIATMAPSPFEHSENSPPAVTKPVESYLQAASIEDIEIEEPVGELFQEGLNRQDDTIPGDMPGAGLSIEEIQSESPESFDARVDMPASESMLEALLEDLGETQVAEPPQLAGFSADTLSEMVEELSPNETDVPPNRTLDELPDSLEDLPAPGPIPLEVTNDLPGDPFDDAPTEPKPVSKTAFSSFAKQPTRAKSGLLSGDFPFLPKPSNPNRPPAPKKPEQPDTAPNDVAKEVAAQSLSEDHTIATETLAGILERQGHFEKAIKMYEKLSLQYPDKSGTFAAKIEKLRNNRFIK